MACTLPYAMNLQRNIAWLAALPLCLFASACAAPEEDRERISTVLSEDGYALFRVEPGSAQRVAFLVEMRDVAEGRYVLLYTPSKPPSTGWFELAADEYVPCRHYGDDETDEVELDCLVPGGHGAIVDGFTVTQSGAPQKLLRHRLVAPITTSTTTSSSSSSKPKAPSGYYAVMRIEETGAPASLAVEVRALDDVAPYDAPSVAQVR
jgi:hypothetical protein